MANYIEINNSSHIVINDSFKNVSYVKRINGNDCRVRVDIFGKGEYLYYLRPPIEQGDVIVLASNQSNIAFQQTNTIYSSKNWGYSANGEEFGVGYLGGGSATDYSNTWFYIFSYHTSSSTTGLEIKDENNQQVFNSNLKYLRVIDTINDFTSRSYGHTVGAVLCGMPCKYRDNLYVAAGITFPSSSRIATVDENANIQTSRPSGFSGGMQVLVVNLDGLS